MALTPSPAGEDVDLALPVHGGDLAAAEARWGVPAQGWLDLSTGVNPWPYPLPSIAAAAWSRLPGNSEHQALLTAAARRWRVGADARVVAAPGSQALIQLLPRLIAPGPVAVIGPTYGEHARAWSAAGHAVAEVGDPDAVGNAAAVVVVNPNNPDGSVLAPARLAALADSLAARGGLLVVDEAFADTQPEISVIPRSRPGLVVLRSFGKFYGLAGLRLGFAVAVPAMAERLAAMLGPWPVSGPALAVGSAALADDAWAVATAARLKEATGRLRQLLERNGLEICGGTALFTLVRHPAADRLYHRLGRAGILVRAFAGRPDRLRLGVPGDESAMARLGHALGD